AAFYTVFKVRDTRREPGKEPEPTSVRLELGKVSPQGQITADEDVSLTVPLEGPATVECGAFVELPRGRLQAGQTWTTPEAKRPARTWQVLGMDTVNGISCLKLEGWQQSSDWDHPRADRTAWRRHDVVWLSPRLGVAQKVERTIERRAPAHVQPTQ